MRLTRRRRRRVWDGFVVIVLELSGLLVVHLVGIADGLDFFIFLGEIRRVRLGFQKNKMVKY